VDAATSTPMGPQGRDFEWLVKHGMTPAAGPPGCHRGGFRNDGLAGPNRIAREGQLRRYRRRFR